jgi:hypothetical protein
VSTGPVPATSLQATGSGPVSNRYRAQNYRSAWPSHPLPQPSSFHPHMGCLQPSHCPARAGRRPAPAPAHQRLVPLAPRCGPTVLARSQHCARSHAGARALIRASYAVRTHAAVFTRLLASCCSAHFLRPAQGMANGMPQPTSQIQLGSDDTV